MGCMYNDSICLRVVLHQRICTLIEVKHRRRIKTEEKAKVVASVWGEEFIQFLAAIAVLL